MNTARNIGEKIVSGTIWMVAARWSMRLIGVVSTLVLARLLSPEDFGVVAVAMIIVGLVEVLAHAGLTQSLIRTPNPEDAHFNTVWSLQIVLGVLVALVIFLSAPYASTYFDNPEVKLVLQILALRSILQGFENPGIIWFRKNMDFHKDFQFLVWKKGIRFFVVVGLALYLGNYWALVYATLVGKVLSVALSYIMHPFRPKIEFSKTREIWSYSLWLLVVQIGHFINARIDAIVLGGMTNTALVGNYTVAADVAQSPTQELVAPMSRVLFSAFSKVQTNLKELERLFLKAFSSLATMCFATGAGVALISEDIVHVILGDKWLAAEPVLFWLGLTIIFHALTVNMTTLLNSRGMAKASAVLSWSRLAFVLPVLIFTARTGDIGLVSSGRFAVIVLLFLPITVLFAWRTKISGWKILRQLIRPLIAALVMGLVLTVIDHIMPTSDLPRLLVKIFFGTLIYSGAISLMWLFSGRPDGLEKTIMSEIPGIIRKVRPS